jgi:hypothetical protein
LLFAVEFYLAETAVGIWFAPKSKTFTHRTAVWMILPALPVANIDPAQFLTRKAREQNYPAPLQGFNPWCCGFVLQGFRQVR